jgi:hypothetical protein
MARGVDIGCWPLTVTMGDCVGLCRRWMTTTQQATKCGSHEKATMGRGGSHSNDDDSEEEVVEEDDGDGNGVIGHDIW